MLPPLSTSLWAATAPPAPPTEPFRGEARTAVAVIGGGFTGLTAALHLAEAGIPVTLLEQGEIGWGASGRNNGQVIPTLSRIDPDEIVAATPPECGGPAKGEEFVSLIRDSASFLFDLIRRYDIAAEAVQAGWLQPAHRPSRLRLAEARVAQWARRGAPVRLYSRAEMAELTGSAHWHGGWGNATGGRINPLAFARGLAAAARRAGAAIHTHSPATALTKGMRGWRITTPNGVLQAEWVILATHAYGGNLWPGLRQSFVPVRSYQVATEILPEAIRGTILPAGHAMSDTRGDLYYFRFDAAGRLVSGGSLILPWAWSERIGRRLVARLRRVFPQIGAVRLSHVWWGYFAATFDRLPHLTELAPGVMGWIGCNGRGVALAVALGRELARAAAGTPLRDLPVPVERRLHRIPFHVLHPLAVAARQAMFRWRDARD